MSILEALLYLAKHDLRVEFYWWSGTGDVDITIRSDRARTLNHTFRRDRYERWPEKCLAEIVDRFKAKYDK